MSSDTKIPYPKSIPLILTTEFCERFSYYGMRAILVLFLSNVLKYSETQSSIVFHGFTVLAYITPIFGAILADSFIGNMLGLNLINNNIISAIQENSTQFSMSPFFMLSDRWSLFWPPLVILRKKEKELKGSQWRKKLLQFFPHYTIASSGHFYSLVSLWLVLEQEE